MMGKLIPILLACLVSLTTTALLSNRAHSIGPSSRAERELAADGAFRDGLYLGRLAAQGGKAFRPPIGRWSNEKDRASFTAGYRRGYEDARRQLPMEVFAAGYRKSPHS
jgi:hypothetical protein